MKHGLFDGIRQPSGDHAMSLSQWRDDGVVGLKMRMWVATESRDDVNMARLASLSRSGATSTGAGTVAAAVNLGQLVGESDS